MIGIVNSWRAGILASAVATAREDAVSRPAQGMSPGDADKVKPSPQGGLSPVSPQGEMGLTAAGAVVYETTSLLADLSGSGRAREVAEPPPKGGSERAYGTASSPPAGMGRGVEDEPVLHTFEIIA